ncbi:ABC transporter permease [Moritella marina ATCC 15381]|uniref:ABC transporter permease n=1 Tax=Moritella marina ATCC 15381 TaxID=1202962 RepID=A0A5J6WS67_MORMI|nr:ABC transporter permease [Moritella marina]QFI39242.1 ABC transporter permease [Moritella marina ATCC 15381]
MNKFLALVVLEIKSVFADRSILLTMFGGIIMYSILYPLPYSQQVSRDAEIVIIDYDRSSVSRELIRMVNATPDAHIAGQVDSVGDAEALIEQGVIKGFLVIPQHFRRDLLMEKPVTLSLGGDASYFMTYSTITSGILKAGGTLSAQIKVARLTVDTESMLLAKAQWQPASLNLQPVFNQVNGYLDYVVPAVFILILQQTLLIVSGILSASQNERSRAKEQGYWLTASPTLLLLARGLVFLGLYLVFSLYYFGFALDVYGVNRLAAAWDILKLLVPFLLAVVCLGVALGQLYNQAETATQVILFSSMPVLFSSGFIWPISEIPTWLVAISQLFPSTAAIQGLLQLNQMGAEFEVVSNFQIQLLIQAFAYGVLAIILLAYKQRQYRLNMT